MLCRVAGVLTEKRRKDIPNMGWGIMGVTDAPSALMKKGNGKVGRRRKRNGKDGLGSKEWRTAAKRKMIGEKQNGYKNYKKRNVKKQEERGKEDEEVVRRELERNN
jgi:hypothetical protein